MKVLVLGSGVIGVTSAWYLSQAGHEVTVLDRQPSAAMETSFANGGHVSANHTEPWAGPGAIAQLLKWLGREDAPLLFRLRADYAQWRWGLRFLLECSVERNRLNTLAALRLALHSRALLQALRRDLDLQYDHSARGILHFFTEPAQFEASAKSAKLFAQFGCERQQLTPQQMLALDPALATALPQLVGGDYAPSEETGDAQLFARALTQQCQKRGVKFSFNTIVERIEFSRERITAVHARDAGARCTFAADKYVVALGSYTPLLLKPLGLHPLIYPVKGYSVTIPITIPDAAPRVGLNDEAQKLVFSRLGERLRVAGTAEFNGHDTSINDVRCNGILSRTALLFPDACDFTRALRWSGLRPATPSNLPYITPTRYRNLCINCGHGTLGWTMACGSGQLLADLVSECSTTIDPSPYDYRSF